MSEKELRENRSTQIGGVKKGGGKTAACRYGSEKGGGKTAARRGNEKEGEERKHGMLANETNKTRS